MENKSLIGSNNETMGTKDWRKALKARPAYRIINRTIKGQTQFISFVAVVGIIILILLFTFPRDNGTTIRSNFYNYTYPLSAPLRTSGIHTFRIGIIADLDTDSQLDKNQWYSLFKKGYLSYDVSKKSVIITWDRNEPIKLTNQYALKGRGMELSELLVFNGRLLTFDDRTGIVFEILNDEILPWLLLLDGDGRSAKGFKSEWATVKDELLYVGSMGKEWTTPTGEFVNHNPQYVKVINTQGQIEHINWANKYNRMREQLGIKWPGYMIHESGTWSDTHESWFFLPRRCSKEIYNEALDEHRGCSVLIMADSDFYSFKIVPIPNPNPTRGFSSFKFVPTSNDEIIVALRTEELNGKTSTYFTSFTVNGKILMEDTLIDNIKYEGFEFI